MSKINLPDITSGYNLSLINDNFQKIEDALNQEVLYRTSRVGEPNEMETNLDMNGKEILNVHVGSTPGSLATKGYVDQEVSEERTYVDNSLSTKYDKTGGVLSGDVLMQGHKIKGLKFATENSEPVTLGQLLDVDSGTGLQASITAFEALRRSYAEAGYNVVGTFQAGFTYVNANDVGIDLATGWGFTGPAGDVAAGTDPTLPGSGYVPRTYVVLRNSLADDNSTVEVGKSTAGDVGNRVSQFATDGEVTGSNDKTAAAAVSVNGVRTSMNCHAFEDWTKINAMDSGLGYSSFDAQAVLDTANDVDHYVGYQSRNIIAGSGDITGYCHAYNAQIQHHGTGNIAGVVGLKVSDPTITNGGTIGELVQVLIEEPTQGTISNYPLYIMGNKPAHLDCPLELSSSTVNSTIRENASWTWTSNGKGSGTNRGGVYFGNSGQMHLFTGNFDDLLVGNTTGVQAKKDFTVEAKFACNNANPQAKAAVGVDCTDLPTAIALINQIRGALIANGICM